MARSAHPVASPPRRARPAGRVSPRRERELFRRVRDEGDRRSRDELTERFMGLAHQVALRYGRRSEPYEDVLQVAVLGLIKAIDRFDPDRGFAFSSFAVPTVAGEVKRHFRDRSWSVRPPRELQERTLEIEQAADDLSARTGRSPTVHELADHVGACEEDVLEAMEARRAREAVSLSLPRGDEEDDTTLGDRIPEVEDGFERAEDRAMLGVLFAQLLPREREILRMRFGQDMTQTEIGRTVGLSQMQVSRVIRVAVDRLRVAAGPPAEGPR